MQKKGEHKKSHRYIIMLQPNQKIVSNWYVEYINFPLRVAIKKQEFYADTELITLQISSFL